jgi:ABC-2 type transport system ATP-binding protein
LADFAIELKGVSKRFGRKLAVGNLDLLIPFGRVYGFLGRNGAGKTTTIKMLLGLLTPSNGNLSVLGLDPRKQAKAIRLQVGYVAENQGMYGWMKVKEIIRFVSGFYPTWDETLVQESLERFELDPKAKVSSLSQGQKMRLALVLALGHRPRLLILDDPTMGLDPISRKEFLNDIITSLHEEGRTIFFSTHLLAEIERVADSVAIIDRGRLKVAGEIDQLKSTTKSIRLTFPQSPPTNITVDGALRIQTNGRDCVLTIRDFDEVKLDLLRLQYNPIHYEVKDLSLDDIFSEYVLSG